MVSTFSSPGDQGPEADDQLLSLSEVWAKKYVNNLAAQEQILVQRKERSSRGNVAQALSATLRSVSAQAWNLTESLLQYEVQRHAIPAELIDPWQISKDIHQIFEKAIDAYAGGLPPERLSVGVSRDLGAIRQRHTEVDSRVIGFVSMQFHYSGQLLVKDVPPHERSLLKQYFKVIDDHLYMPLQRAYEAAASYDYHSPRLQTVRALLPQSTAIARAIVSRVGQLYPSYRCYSGRLNSEAVRVSSIRDAEMFQIYLWTCVLEKNISAIAQELFPLCVMLYPTLNVSWELVRHLINLLEEALNTHVPPQQAKYYQPYHQALWRMFSPEVFPEVKPLDSVRSVSAG